MRDINYEIQYRHHVQRWHCIMYREDIASYTRKNRRRASFV